MQEVVVVCFRVVEGGEWPFYLDTNVSERNISGFLRTKHSITLYTQFVRIKVVVGSSNIGPCEHVHETSRTNSKRKNSTSE